MTLNKKWARKQETRKVKLKFWEYKKKEDILTQTTIVEGGQTLSYAKRLQPIFLMHQSLRSLCPPEIKAGPAADWRSKERCDMPKTI